MSDVRTSQPIRVASVPHSQVYIRHLEAWETEATRAIHRLPDPPPAGGSHFEQSRWWPPAMLSAAWIEANHSSFDLMHVHFGFDAVSPAELVDVLGQLRKHGKPLVYTVHDLFNPHQLDPTAHRRLLDILIPGADQLITLTTGAAQEIHAHWDAMAVVLPHPHVVDFATMDELRSKRRALTAVGKTRPFRVGVHLKGLRPNMDPRIVEALARVTSRLPKTTLQVNIHSQPLDPSHHEYQPQLAGMLKAGAAAGLWELHIHEYFSESELFTYLASLDASVLPYRFGTHSGWLEAVLDIGTNVVAPDCGYYSDQQDSVKTFKLTKHGVDEDSLRRALQPLLGSTTVPGLNVGQRQEQRRFLAKRHEEIYAGLLDRPYPRASPL